MGLSVFVDKQGENAVVHIRTTDGREEIIHIRELSVPYGESHLITTPMTPKEFHRYENHMKMVTFGREVAR